MTEKTETLTQHRLRELFGMEFNAQLQAENASLAAAVEAQRDALLEALRAAVADWDEEVSRGRWLDAARAAIKKAEEA